MDRRRFLSTLLASAGAAVGLAWAETALGRGLALVAPPEARDARAPALLPAQPAAATPAQAVAGPAHGLPLRAGMRCAHCVVDTVGELRCGTIPVVLRDPAGRRFQVDVARRELGGPAGIASTRRLSLYLANGGSGRTPTEEAHGLAVMALAQRLRLLERAGTRWPDLLSIRERTARHPDGAYQIC